jgi:hypothetical protein
MIQSFYASSLASIAAPMVLGPLLAIWIIGRKNLVGRTLYRGLSGTNIFWAGTALLAILTGGSLIMLARSIASPNPAIVVSADDMVCEFQHGPLAVPWSFVVAVRPETRDYARRGATIHQHFATLQLDGRYLDRLPWSSDERRRRQASCGLDNLDKPPETIFHAMEMAWRSSPR